jgi:hypothetical protein
MNERQKHDFDQIVTEDAASEATGCFGSGYGSHYYCGRIDNVLVAIRSRVRKGKPSCRRRHSASKVVNVLTPSTTNALLVADRSC